MAYTARHLAGGQSGLAHPPGRDGRGGAEPDRAVAPVSLPPWTRAVGRFAHVALWALPAHVCLLGAVTLLRLPDPDADFAGYAAYVTTDRYRVAHLVGMAAGWLSLVGLVALAALLAGTPAGRTATVGLLAGIAAVVLTAPLYGLGAFAQPAVGWSYLRGETSAAMATNAGMHGSAATALGLLAAAVTTLTWLLTGLAVLRSRVLNAADGVLLMLAAPLVGIGGLLVGLIPTVGALLLLAGTLGLAWTATRIIPTG